MSNTLTTLLAREWRLEWRTRDTLLATGFFAAATVLILSMTVADSAVGREAAGQAAILWIAITFATTLALARAFARESEGDALTGLLLTPIHPSWIYTAKVLSGLLFVGITEVLTILLLGVLLNIDVDLSGFLMLIAIGLIGTLGLLALGLLLSAMTMGFRAREVMLPVLLFPLLVPLLLPSTALTRHALQGTFEERDAIWAAMLVFFDVLYIVIGTLLFPYVVRES